MASTGRPPAVATTSTSGSLASAASVGATNRLKLWFATVPCVTSTTLLEPSSSCAQDGSGTWPGMIGGVPTKCTEGGSWRGNSKLVTDNCMSASGSSTTEWNSGTDTGPTSMVFSV